MGSLALTGLSSWLWLFRSGTCSQGAGLQLSQFTVSPSRCRHRFTVSLLCWHNLTCLSRYNVSFSGVWWNFTIVQLQAAFLRCLSVLLLAFVGRRL
ncbi:hypothetical protein BKA91DRAFT_141992 [Yarrowia lipolytica]|nr:hypothetical protein BKA91DRAFT_141992 [Yarrowia lipolytica]KAE8169495.1 hypothetical protein BKA90DRAFT_142510 [Yarrowia lipolytica]RMI94773.1 hypothetical protein BD777DRAFT_131195 [Yarrowia lipolytica]